MKASKQKDELKEEFNRQNHLIDGFNNGYLLKSRAPKLADKFVEIFTEWEDDYSTGFIAGVKEKEMEEKTKTRNYTIRRSSPAHRKNKDKNKDKEKDRDFRDL